MKAGIEAAVVHCTGIDISAGSTMPSQLKRHAHFSEACVRTVLFTREKGKVSQGQGDAVIVTSTMKNSAGQIAVVKQHAAAQLCCLLSQQGQGFTL